MDSLLEARDARGISVHTAKPRGGPQGGVLIGARNLPGKDATVLRALVRLLDGSVGTGLGFSDDLSECEVVFTSSAQGARPGRLLVLVTEPGAEPALPQGAVAVTSPLRMSSVLHALQRTLSQARPPGATERAQGLSALFVRLHLALRNGGLHTLPIGAARLLLIDAATQTVFTGLSAEQLLSPTPVVGELRPATAVDVEVLRGERAQPLPPLLWRLSAELVRAAAVHAPPEGTWRLKRWPSAAGLQTPGHPRLAAWLSRQPCSAAQLVERTGLSPDSVSAFLSTCDALGLIEDAAGDAPHGHKPAGPAREAPGWIALLRERLQLW